MAEVTREHGITFDLPDGYLTEEVTRAAFGSEDEPTAGELMIAALEEEEDAEVLLDEQFGLERAAFDTVEELEPVDLNLPKDIADRSLVLVDEDGLLRWILPEREEGTHRRFRLFKNTDSPFGGGLVERARAWVIRLKESFDGETARNIIAKLDRKRDGLVEIAGWKDSAKDWIKRKHISKIPIKDSAGPPRILLLIHGTFSHVGGSYGKWTDTRKGRNNLKGIIDAYDAVIGWDHKSMAKTPLENAAEMCTALMERSWPQGTTFDVITTSRGGLVGRTFVEHVAPLQGFGPRIVRMIMIAPPLGGTLLMSPEHWVELANRFSTIASSASKVLRRLSAGTRGNALNGLSNAIVPLVRMAMNVAVEKEGIPGLAAMSPDGDYVKWLNSVRNEPWPVEPTSYYTLATPFTASGVDDLDGLEKKSGLPRRVLLGFADGAVDSLFQDESNDLVVNNNSARIRHERVEDWVEEDLVLPENAVVHHLNFFMQPGVLDLLNFWLEVGDRGAFDDEAEFKVLGMDELIAEENPPEMAMVDRGGDETGPFDQWDDEPMSFDGGFESFDGPSAVDDGAASDAESAAQAVLRISGSIPPKVAVKKRTALAIWLTRGLVDRIASKPGEFNAKADVPLRMTVLDTEGSLTVLDEEGNDLPKGWMRDIDVPGLGETRLLDVPIRAAWTGKARLTIQVSQGMKDLYQLVIPVEVVKSGHAPEAPMLFGEGVDTASASNLEHQLQVIEVRSGEGVRFRYQMQSHSLGINRIFMSEELEMQPGEVARGFYDEIEEGLRGSGSVLDALERVGDRMWTDLIPTDLQKKLWKHRHELTMLQIKSDERTLPWEVLRIQDPEMDEDEVVTLAELGVVRGMWNTPEPDTLSLERAHLVAPDTPDLPQVKDEAVWLVEQGFERVEGDRNTVKRLLRQLRNSDAIHISCHGVRADDSNWVKGPGLQVAPGSNPDVLWEADLPAPNEAKALDQPTLVFLNACHGASAIQGATRFSGWARTFLMLGAGAFIAPLWSVSDGGGRQFTELFYSGLKDGLTLGAAVQAAREGLRASRPDDPTWMAFSVYAQPSAALKKG